MERPTRTELTADSLVDASDLLMHVGQLASEFIKQTPPGHEQGQKAAEMMMYMSLAANYLGDLALGLARAEPLDEAMRKTISGERELSKELADSAEALLRLRADRSNLN